MANIDSLVNTLQNSSVNNAVYHEITINFPATELLPADTDPYLEEPKHVAYREKPDLRDYRRDPTDLRYFVYYKVDWDNKTSSEVPHVPGTDLRLLAAMERIQAVPSHSTMDVVAFQRERELSQEEVMVGFEKGDDVTTDRVIKEVIYRVRLTTTLEYSDRTVNQTEAFEYAELERDAMAGFAEEDCSWLAGRHQAPAAAGVCPRVFPCPAEAGAIQHGLR
jgi:hypothetical protein